MSVEGRPLDETELIEKAIGGDHDAFEELVRMHQRMALRVAYLVIRDHGEAEDVTQDALVKAHGSLGRFRPGSPFRPWLLRIVRNEALNRARGSSRRRRLELRASTDPASGGAAPSPEAVTADRDMHERSLRALESLPEPYSSVLTYRFLLDLSEEETARALGIPKGTVKSRTSRGLLRLRRALSGEGGHA